MSWNFCSRFTFMAKPRLDLRTKKDIELKFFAQSVIRAMLDSPYFVDQQAKVEAAALIVTDYESSLTEVAVEKAALDGATRRKQAARKSVEQTLTDLSALVSVVSEGNAVVIVSSNMELRSARSPLGQLPQVLGLRAEPSPFEGACDLSWKLVKGSSVYEVEYKLGAADAPWQKLVPCTASKMRVSDLTPGVLYYFRVRAIGAAGAGPWSNEGQRRAP